MEIVEVSEDRHQVLDARGRFVAGFGSRLEAEAYLQGYKDGRADGATFAAQATEGLAARIAGRA